MKDKFGMIDEVIVEHRDSKGKLIRRHRLNSSLWHRIKVKLGLDHNSMTATSFSDISNWISGIANPGVAYGFMGIGTGTAADAVGDTSTAFSNSVKITAVTPTLSSTAQTNDTINWVHTFSSTDTLTGTSAIDEVCIASAATSFRMLLHIAGTAHYGAADSCQWANGDTLAITIKCQIEQGT